ncbi:hypothetical protein [Neobacillus bataviensis]|uniref:hypothetical protein n=1 Tax=Neobacillus bataviensis TaxID=220685 RepID=UPI001CBEF923|nr:hypothetical protein [Neobacillus bataviensis]
MSHFSPVNGWLHYTNRAKQSPEIMSKRRVDLSYQNASAEDLGQGFKRYTWRSGVLINSRDYLEFRLEAQENEGVISAGYLSDPMENIYSLQNGPIQPNVMVLVLHNASNTESAIFPWLVVKGEI